MRLIAIAFLLATFTVGTLAAVACTPAEVTRLSLEAVQTEFQKAPTISLGDVVARSLKADGGFLIDGTGEVYIEAPVGLTMTVNGGTDNTTHLRSLSAGASRFQNIVLTNPPKGTHFILFHLICGGTLRHTDRLEVTITFTDADRADYFTKPELSITNFGTFPIPPVMAYFNNGGDVADLTNYDTWTLITNDTELNAIISGNTFTPTMNTGLLITFDNLRFNMNPGTFEGRKFELRLQSIGALLPGGTIAFPSPLVMVVANCRTDYYIGPDVAGASRDNLVIGQSSDGNNVWFTIQGWGGFPGSSSALGACSFGGAVTQYKFIDVCNIACSVPGVAGRRGILRIAIDGYSYEDFGDVAVVGPPSYLATPETTIRLVRQPVTYAKVPFQIVDQHGSFLGQRIANAADRRIECRTTSPFQHKWVKTSYSDPYQGDTVRTPNFNPLIADSEAEVELVFNDEFEPDRHQFCCHVSGGVLANETCITIEVYEDCTSPPIITDVDSVGCIRDGSNNLMQCKTQGGEEVTVSGSGFGYANAKIRIGPAHCDETVHHPEFPASKLVGRGCRGTGSGHEVLVLRYEEQVWAKWDKTYTFNVAPRIDSIVGCSDFYPSVANCLPDGSSMVQIRGSGFGAGTPRVLFYYYDPPGATLWIEPNTIIPVSDTKVNASNFPGQGRRFAVAVESAIGERTVETEVTMSYRGSDIVPCKKAANGKQCNARGDCNLVVGSCVCFQNPTNGYWSGEVCDDCLAGYWGTDCKNECPGGAANSCSGVAQGTCNDGVAGDGTCSCRSGYGGTSCASICPGGVSAPCNNHGTCIGGVDPPVCQCSDDNTNGHFGGAACDQCNPLYVGVDCNLICPTQSTTPNSACSGHGVCSSGSSRAICTCATDYCGADCSKSQAGCGHCDPGKWGDGCANFCPGYVDSAGVVTSCSQHGSCNQGTYGTGDCVCDAGFATADCSVRCSGTPICSAHGQCDTSTGDCVCESSYATTDCSVACPGTGTTGGVCSSHGTCDAGRTGTASCTCSSGYTYADCSRACPGGVASPCSLHGDCLIDETCKCHNDTLAGFWTGTECNTCVEGYYGRFCNGTCPKTDGVQCATHGTCTFEVKCACFDDAIDGFWAEPNCNECKANYYGATCRSQCPGGSCNACSGHGICSDGITGTGACTCFNTDTDGYWQGVKCDTCQEHYWGRNCTNRCPETPDGVCSNRGQCWEGLHGNGTCACQRSLSEGFWAGDSCEKCLTGFYGSGCKSSCPGTDVIASTTCSGHGTCNDGHAGDGTCTCQPFYASAACDAYCERSATGVRCNGHGNCRSGATGDGGCDCQQSSASGYWEGDLCENCVYGWWGPSCNLECPKAGGIYCGGHGTCDSSTTGSGSCMCNDGYAGLDCTTICQGGASNPCNGKGTCDRTTGDCTCYENPTFGYWTGVDCRDCHPLWTSFSCNVACPTNPVTPTVPCTGHGDCYDGTCTCQSGFCSADCSDTSCGSECARGKWGPSCLPCPGYSAGPPVAVCNSNGHCSEGTTGTGRCSCLNGFWGDDCANDCQGGSATPCSNHGSCSVTTGDCTCASGYASSTCGVECQGGASNPCSGFGACNLADGSCTCHPGYAGAACEKTCPGGVLLPCNGHGTCDQTAATCTCQQTDATGHWDGAECNVCAGGYRGPECKDQCVNGVTEGQVCKCNVNWSGKACDQPCPGYGTSDGICSSHGQCLYGESEDSGRCKCDDEYFTTDCSIRCTKTMCQTAPHFLVNGECDKNTGQCVCQDNDVDGHWADPATRCTTCLLFWWGTKCEKRCPCLDHGGCDKFTGDCQCFDSDADGHFAGVACERCKVGYIGADCRNKDIIITRQKPCSSIAQVSDTSAFLILDHRNDIIVTGGRPVLVCNLTSRTLMNTIDMNATVVAGSLNGDTILLTLNGLESQGDKAMQQNVLVARSRNPDFAVLQEGTPYLPHDTTINRTTTTTSHRGFDAMTVGSTRSLQTVHVYQKNTVVAKVKISDDSFLTFQSNGVVLHTVGLERVAQYSFSTFFNQVMTAGITETLLISPPVIFVAGMRNGHFKIITIRLPMQQTNVVQDITSRVEGLSSFCQAGNCKAVAKLVTEGTYVVMAVLGQEGAAIMRFRYTQLFGTHAEVESNRILDRYPSGTIINVTALLLDPLSNAGFVAVNLKSPDTTDPSTIFKFDLLTLQIYGSVRFQKVVDNYEIVAALEKDDDARILFATVPLAVQINVVPLNLYAVIKLFPDMADTVGGTVITVEGEGFIADRVFNCDFNGTIVPAQYVSSREALCVAPAGGDERCSGVPLEISVTEDQYTKNNVLLRRVATPRIEKVYAADLQHLGTDNAYGDLAGGTVVVLEGYGFQDSPYLNCRFSSTEAEEVRIARYADRDYQYSSGAQGTRYNHARFINATHVHCEQPGFVTPTKGIATVEVTLDGTVYSTSRRPYEVIGEAVGLSTFRQQPDGIWVLDDDGSFESQSNVTIPPIDVFVVDEQQQRLRTLDLLNRTIEVTFNFPAFREEPLRIGNTTFNFSAYCDVPKDTTDRVDPEMHPPMLVQEAVNGRATFAGISFLHPLAGDYYLTFRDTTSGWTYQHHFKISVGKPHRLRICKQPSSEIDNEQRTLPIQPILYVEDISTNQLPSASLVGLRVEAEYTTEKTETTAVDQALQSSLVRLGVPVKVVHDHKVERRVAEQNENFMVFDGLEMTGLFGNTYTINFTSADLIHVTSWMLSLKWCRDNSARAASEPNVLMYFAKMNTSECFLCPEGGICDGTNNVQVGRDNLWRPTNDSYKFYSCATPDSSNSCLSPNGRCKVGYEGPRCSVCAPGYGHQGSYCYPCRAPGEVVGYVLALILVAILFIGVIVYASLSSKLSETLPVLMKIAINHFQISSRINQIIIGMPPVLKKLFDIQLQLSELVRFDIVSSECPPLKLSVYGEFALVLSMPFMMMACFAIFLTGLYFYRKRHNIGIKCIKVEIPMEKEERARRDRVMLVVGQFFTKLRDRAREHHGDVERDDMRPQFYTCKQYFAAMSVIIMLLVYPTMLQWCVLMWSCDDIVFGDAGSYQVMSFLKTDRGVDCNSDTHKRVQIIAITAALIYLVSIPATAIGLVYYHWQTYGRVHARRLYVYVVAGYDVSTWFWEAVVTMRKAVVVFVIIFVSDSILRTYFCMWAMTLALGAHGWFQPFDPNRPSLYYLEGLGIATVVVTLNLALLFQFDVFAEGKALNTVLVVFLFALNTVVLLILAGFIVYNAFLRARAFFFECRARFKGDDENPSTEEETESADGTLKRRASSFVGSRANARRSVQREGLLGAIRRASHAHFGVDAPKSAVNKKIDVRNIPLNDNETPFERLQRLEAEREKEAQREHHVQSQAELEKELADLKQQMVRAKALAAAEEAVIAKFPEVAEMRQKHEDELYRLMDEIRQVRGDYAVGAAGAILAARGGDEDSDQLSEADDYSEASGDDFEMRFDDDDDDN